jgi:hypothetical protein
MCDCELSHNGMGIASRVCDCNPDADRMREDRDERRRLEREFPYAEDKE